MDVRGVNSFTLPSAAEASPTASPTAGSPTGGSPGLFSQLLGQVTQLHERADQSVVDLATGRTDNLHNTLLAAAQADVAFRLVLEIRNRLTEAYQELMRMQM